MLRNHRGERVVRGDPRAGTYRAEANQEHVCMRCHARIAPGDEFAEDLVLVCGDCDDEMNRILRVREHLRQLAQTQIQMSAIAHGGFVDA